MINHPIPGPPDAIRVLESDLVHDTVLCINERKHMQVYRAVLPPATHAAGWGWESIQKSCSVSGLPNLLLPNLLRCMFPA